MKFTDSYYEAITNSIATAEEKTTAEFVVVIHPYSGNYRDVAYLIGAFIAWLTLIFILFSEQSFTDYVIPIELPIVFAITAYLASFTPLRRWFTSAKRRRQQVSIAAITAFYKEEVSHTRARTGVLIYYSALERNIEILADTGVLAAIPSPEWEKLLAQLLEKEKVAQPAQEIQGIITSLGDFLAKYLPATEDNPDELPNRPRIVKG